MTASAPRKRAALNDSVRQRAAASHAARKTDSVQEDIASNPFHQVLFDPSKSLEERRKEVGVLMTSTLDRSQDRARIAEYKAFREWLSQQARELARQTIRLTNLDTMTEMQNVLRDLNADLLDFDERMAPIMGTVEAVYELRTNGVIIDAFREIQNEQARREEIEAEIKVLEAEIAQAESERSEQRNIKAKASADRSFLGLGAIKASARETIARADMQIEEIETRISGLRDRIGELKTNAPDESRLGDLAIHKERLRELLDLSADENRGRVKDLRDSALKFIETAETRTGGLRGQFDSLQEQIETVVDSNTGMRRTHLVLVEGLEEAEKANTALRTDLTETEGESALERSIREEKLQSLDRHIKMVRDSKGETLATAGELEQQSIRVNTMQEATQQQIDTARILNTQGVTATADRLATVLTAVGGAALGEASAVAQDTLDAMRRSTNDISEREVIRVAMGGDLLNDQLEQITEELSSLREVQVEATHISRSAMSDMHDNMARLREEADATRQALKDYVATAANTESDANGTPRTADAGSDNPFLKV